MKFKPVLDRVLLKRVKEPDIVNGVALPERYAESDKYEVVALGDFVILGGKTIPLYEIVREGDIVLVSEYNIEAVEIDGKKLFLTRLQDIKGRERVESRARAAS